MLQDFLRRNRETLIARCRSKVATRRAPRATEQELSHGIPLFLDQLVDTLRLELASGSSAAETAPVAPPAIQKTTASPPDIGSAAALHGNELLRRGFTVGQVVHLEFIVAPIEKGLAVEGDRQILAAALANVLQNAVKFTRPHGRVSLNAYAVADRILIGVEDECGGLPEGKAEEIFRPFEQCSAERTGLGLGLPISRRGVEANGGQLHVRNLPGTGCVFTIDLPRAAPPFSSEDG